MEHVIEQTPSGHTVTFKPSLSYPEKRRLQRVFLSGAHFNPATGEQDFDLGVQIEAQDTLLKLMIVRMKLANGTVLEGGQAVYNGLAQVEEADIQFLYDKLDDLTKDIDIFPTTERGEKTRQTGA